jgi:toxin ParE1/3/4
MPILLSPEAQSDVADILLYTLQRWGEEQLDRYAAALDHSLQLIADNPELGRARPELFTGCRSLRVREHIVYYALRDATVVVFRVLHGRMDAIRYLKR